MVFADPNPLLPPPRPRFGDLVAGVAVALILIPQALAYAEIAGLPPPHGLYAAALPPVAAALVASSPYLQTGPVAMTALLSFGILSSIATPGSAEYVGLAALLALVVGAVRLLIGLIGAGVVSHFMSRPVLAGFTSAAAMLIVASQIPAAVDTAAPEGHLLFRAGWALGHPGEWHWGSILLAAVAVTVVAAGRRIHPLFPGVVLATVIGLAAGGLVDAAWRDLGDLPSGLPPFSLSLPWSRIDTLLLPGTVIALVGFAEPAAIALSFAARDRMRWDPNREFVGQGLANLAAAVSGGFPVGGSFARSSINRLSGARTRWSGAVTGLTVLAFLPITGILEPLPTSVLAGIVIAAVTPLIRPHDLLRIVRYSMPQGAVALATFGLTLALAPRIDEAVLIGIGMGISVHLVRELRVEVRVDAEGDTLRIQPAGVLFFGSAHVLNDVLLSEMARHPEATRLDIDLSGVGRLDYTGAVALRSLGDQAEEAGLTVTLSGVSRTVRRIVDSVWHDRPPGWSGPWRRSDRDPNE